MNPIVLPPSSPEDRTGLYEDIRALLSPGFLAEAVEYEGHSFVLRTLTAEEIIHLRWRVRRSDPDYVQKAWMIASSVWMVGGQIIDGEQGVLLELVQMFERMDGAAREVFFQAFLQLRRRVQVSLTRSEAFLYETESRYLWAGQGAHIQTRGTQNGIQHLWVYYNVLEDRREHNQHLWALTKFIAGTQAPKGIQKLNTRDKKHEKTLEKKRQRVCDQMFYTANNIEFPKAQASDLPWLVINPLESEEDLQREFGNWVSGKKDTHDQIVDFVKNKIRQEAVQQQLYEEKRAKELQTFVEADDSARTLRPVDPATAAKLMAPRPKQVHLDTHKHNSARDKYIFGTYDSGQMQVDESGRASLKGHVDPKALAALRNELAGHAPEEAEERWPRPTIEDHTRK